MQQHLQFLEEDQHQQLTQAFGSTPAATMPNIVVPGQQGTEAAASASTLASSGATNASTSSPGDIQLLPKSVTVVSAFLFAGYKLTSITIPSTIRLIEEGAFAGCRSLRSVKILHSDDLNFGMIIGKSAFSECTQLTSVNLPGSVRIIGERAFFGCSELVAAAIPMGAVSIGKEAFAGCSKLQFVTMPTLTGCKLGSDAFKGTAVGQDDAVVHMEGDVITITTQMADAILNPQADLLLQTSTTSPNIAADALPVYVGAVDDALSVVEPPVEEDVPVLDQGEAVVPVVIGTSAVSWAGLATRHVPNQTASKPSAVGTAAAVIGMRDDDDDDDDEGGGGLAVGPAGTARNTVEMWQDFKMPMPQNQSSEQNVMRIDPTDMQQYTQDAFYNCYNGLAEWDAAGEDWLCSAGSCSTSNGCYQKRCTACRVPRPLKKAAMPKKSKFQPAMSHAGGTWQPPAMRMAGKDASQKKKKKKKKKTATTTTQLELGRTGKEVKVLLKEYNWAIAENNGLSQVYGLKRNGVCLKTTVNFAQMNNGSMPSFQIKQKYKEILEHSLGHSIDND